MKVLGIESSHDDTSIALVENNQVVHFFKISQTDIHQQYGGTIPELAARHHFHNYYYLLEKLKEVTNLHQIDYIAYTKEPGLIGSLQMGHLFSHALAKALKKPLIDVNHIHGHIFSSILDTNHQIKYPALALIVSGGHTNLYLLKSSQEKILIGQTLDDALGEVYDKVARVLFNVFPGGKYIDDIFSSYKEQKIEVKLSDPKLLNLFDFSFSGYKTQIINLYHYKKVDAIQLALAFQKQVVDFIIAKMKLAINQYQPQSIILAGGVSANSYLRSEFLKLHSHTLIPLMKYTTDNGAMIAIAAIEEKLK